MAGAAGGSDAELVVPAGWTLQRRAGRDRFVRQLNESGVPCTPFYPHTLYQNPLYAKQPCRVMGCPEAEARLTDAFWISHRVLLAERKTIRQVAGLMKDATLKAVGAT